MCGALLDWLLESCLMGGLLFRLIGCCVSVDWLLESCLMGGLLFRLIGCCVRRTDANYQDSWETILWISRIPLGFYRLSLSVFSTAVDGKRST